MLDTDASSYTIGAILSQIQEGQERVVAYYSRTLNRAEQQYCVTRKELLALVEAVKTLSHLLVWSSLSNQIRPFSAAVAIEVPQPRRSNCTVDTIPARV